jgi:hypothetical protein
MTTATTSEPKTSGRVEANGVDYYYEIHGQGEPFLLLRGGLGSIDMFGPVLPVLTEHREVIGVDLHGPPRFAQDRRGHPRDRPETSSSQVRMPVWVPRHAETGSPCGWWQWLRSASFHTPSR